MKIISRPGAMAELARRWAGQGRSIGLVPTMGALHEGHASLLRRARKENDRVIASIFVNPAQFGPNEDFARYPRTFSADRKLCAACRVDAVYHPSAERMYPAGFRAEVEVKGFSEVLCGAFRPGHFKGVATVVLKLLNACSPTRAYFGEKDFQQLAIIKRMASDLELSTKIVGCPTVREPDGLALSSRNRYLNPIERSVAPLLYAALSRGARLARRGRAPAALAKAVEKAIGAIPEAAVDYVKVVNPSTLTEPKRLAGRLRLLAAIRLGKTRLIDNIALSC